MSQYHTDSKYDGLVRVILETEKRLSMTGQTAYLLLKPVDYTKRAKQPVKDWYTYPEAAVRISDIIGYEISVKTLRRLVADGRLLFKKIGNRVFISEQFISKYLQEPDICPEAKVSRSNYTGQTLNMVQSSGQDSKLTGGMQSGTKVDANASAAQALNMMQKLRAQSK